MKKQKFSLGWELEACRAASNIPEYVECGTDGSVNGDHLEYRIKERAVDSIQQSVGALQTLLKDRQLKTDTSCGFHVHLGLKDAKKLDAKTPALWAAWCVTLGKSIEKAAFDAVPPSRAANSYCRRWVGTEVSEGIIRQEYNASKHSNDHRYQWINVTEMFRQGGIKTVEIRLMGESRRYPYIMAWVSFCILLGEAAFRLVQDPSLLDIETNNLTIVLSDIRRNIRLSTGDKSNKTAIELMRLAKLTPTVFTRFDEYLEIENYIRQELIEHEKGRWHSYHIPKISEKSGRMIAPRSPVTGCGCDICENTRRVRLARRQIAPVVVFDEMPDTADVMNEVLF